MEQSPSWEANRSSATQKIPSILWIWNVHYRIHKSPPSVPILSHIDTVHAPPHHFYRSHLRLSLSRGLLPSGFPTKALYAPLLSPYVLHALPISVFFTWSPECYLVRNTGHQAPCYVVFSTPPLPLRTKYTPQHPILENPQSTFKFMTICVKGMISHGLVSCKICTHVS